MSSMMRAWVAGIWKEGSSKAEREWVSDRKKAERFLSHSASLMRVSVSYCGADPGVASSSCLGPLCLAAGAGQGVNRRHSPHGENVCLLPTMGTVGRCSNWRRDLSHGPGQGQAWSQVLRANRETQLMAEEGI